MCMTKNGCFNRAPLRETATVQAGWLYKHHSRYAVLNEILDPMSKACVYQRDKKDDPKCEGCRWIGS